jgi:hypothetical protein
MLLNLLFELLSAVEIVIYAILLLATWCAACGRDGETEFQRGVFD